MQGNSVSSRSSSVQWATKKILDDFECKIRFFVWTHPQPVYDLLCLPIYIPRNAELAHSFV